MELTGYPQNRTPVPKWRAGRLVGAVARARAVLGDCTATDRQAGPIRYAICCRVRNVTIEGAPQPAGRMVDTDGRGAVNLVGAVKVALIHDRSTADRRPT